jgi:CHAT domain-containing protein
VSCNAFGVAMDLVQEQEFLEEAKAIAAIFSYDNKVNSKYIENPSKEQVLQNLDADILHFSCHGYFYDKDPLESGIVLKDKETLTAKDFLSLAGDKKINADIVTLSACDTGINQNKPGDELIGLTRSLLYAGANSLILSLWPVSSLAAKELMISFYNNLKNGDTKAASLQKAQIDLRNRWSKKYEKEVGGHPYFWAPFILIGDWR